MNVTCGKNRSLLLLGAALLLAVAGCSSAMYQEDYRVQVSVAQAEGSWDQASIAVVVFVVHDADNYRPWEGWNTKAEIRDWINVADADRDKLAKERRCWTLSVKTGDPTKKHYLSFRGEGVLGTNAQIHAVANLDAADAASCHRFVTLLNTEEADFVLYLSPKGLTLRAAAPGEVPER